MAGDEQHIEAGVGSLAEDAEAAAEAMVDDAGESIKEAATAVPLPLRVAAAWSWRLIVVGVVAIAVWHVIAVLGAIVLPLVIALLIAAPLERLVSFFERMHIPRGLGAAIAILLLIAAVAGLSYAVGTSVINGFDSLRSSATEGFNTLVDWLVEGPIHVTNEQIDGVVQEVQNTVRDNAWGLASSAINVTSVISALVAGIVLAIISLYFFMKDGAQMWRSFVRVLPSRARKSVDSAGRAGWSSLRRYTQTSVFVAFIDAVGIGTGAWILGVPLALPIAIAVFLFSFIPLFGAGISGAIAVLVALVDGGWKAAVIMLLIVLFVQQTEGNILYPWLFGKAAAVHPMAILLAVSSGTLLAGLAGAVIAVPILAFSVAFGRGLHHEFILSREEEHPITGQIPLLAEKSMDALRRARTRVTTTQIRVRKRRKRD